MNEQQLHEEVEKTIASFDQDGSLAPNPFLVTRIQGALDARARDHGLLSALRVNLGYITIVVILMLNIITLVYHMRRTDDGLQQQLVSDLREDLENDQFPFNF
jgi:hypothetical protein